jgi:hypothetical protein
MEIAECGLRIAKLPILNLEIGELEVPSTKSQIPNPK